MKTLERLRQMKSKTLDRMEALNALTKKESRDLTDAEAQEWALKRALVEDLNTAIAELERAPSQTLPPAVEAKPNSSDWLAEMDKALGIPRRFA